MTLRSELSALDDRTWGRALATINEAMSIDQVFAPHYTLVFRRAFGQVRNMVLAEAPLVPPARYSYFRHEPGTVGADAVAPRIRAVLGPAERLLFVLFAAAAAATAEPHLDRRRVFSALPAGNLDPFLLASTQECAAQFGAAVHAELRDARWPLVVEIDVARAGTGFDRQRLLADLIGFGLPHHWASAGQRLWSCFAPTVGPRGVPDGLLTSGTLVTIALRDLDRRCAERGHCSFRLIDGLTAPAADAEAAVALERDLHAGLAALGLAANDKKSRIAPTDELLREWRELDERRPDRPGGGPEIEVARAAMTDLEQFGKHRFKSEQWALLRLGRARDPAALDHALSGFAGAPWAARIYALYIGQFLEDAAVRGRFETMLHEARDRLRSWQWMWGLSALWSAPAISPRSAALLAAVAGAARLPDTARATAAIVWARFATERGWQALEALAEGSRSSYLRAAVAFGFRYRAPAIRQVQLAAWARLDPQVALVATAIERDLAAPVTAHNR